MPIITSGLYKVTLEQTYRGITCYNTYFYLNTLGMDDEQETCAQAFDEDVLTNQALAQHTSVVYDAIRVENVTGDLADYVRVPSTSVGELVGTPLNSFTAAGIRLNRTTKETRNGQKRVCGQTEEVATAQSWEASYLAILDNLGLAFSQRISTTGGLFDPVIARQDTVDPDNWIINPVASYTVNAQITSQVSRKV
jgi:hypothetical protein